MEIYVNSGGVSPEHDYTWKKIDNSSQEIIDYPPVVKRFNYLLESKAPSLLLARHDKKLLLLVADLASTRKDYQGRLIRNSVAWVAENSDESELLLRKLAVRALESFAKKEKLLENAIDDAIKSDPEQGFLAVNLNALKVESLVENVEVETNPLDSKLKIAKIAKADFLHKLIDELKEFKLPDRQGPLVVYTRNKAQSALEEARVWRGLSSLVKVEGWKEYESELTPKPLGENVRKSVSKLVDDITRGNFPIGIIAVVLLLPAIVALFIFLDNEPPTISDTPAEIVEAGDSYSFTPTAEDKDNDPIEFSIENKPTWATFDEKTGQLSGQPTDDDVGTTSNIVISVSDGKKTASLPPFPLTVKFNHPPSINGTIAEVVQVGVGESYSFTPTAEDKDGNPIQFSIENKPTWATFDEKTGQLSGQPTDADVGTTPNIIISVSDGKKTASLPPFALTVEKDIAE